MNKKLYAIIAFCLLTISTPAKSMHYVRAAIQKLTFAMPQLTAVGMGGIALYSFKKTESGIRRTESASQEVTEFVHNTLIEHGIPKEKALEIQVKKEKSVANSAVNASAHTSVFGESYIIIPTSKLQDELHRKKIANPLWKSTLIHEYSHIKNKDNLKETALIFLASFTMTRGRVITIPLKLAATVGATLLHSKYAEYRADQEAIKRCSSETLYAEARDYVWYSRQTKNLFLLYLRKRYDCNDEKYWEKKYACKKIKQLQKRYETDLLYREYLYSKITGDWDHPSNLTRYNYFIAAAKEKEQQEKFQEQLLDTPEN